MSNAHPLGEPDTLRLPDGRSLSLRRAGSGLIVAEIHRVLEEAGLVHSG